MNFVVERIEELRKIKGLTKIEMANKSGISRSSVNNWYYSEAIPSLTFIENLCNAFDITVEQFFCGMGKEHENPMQDKFLDSWRLLNAEEKLAVRSCIAAFKADKAVKND